MSTPDVLLFADRKVEGAYPVAEPSGAIVARIQVPWTGTSFTATTGQGEPLCSGRRPHMFSQRWQAFDHAGRLVAELKPSFTGIRKTVTLGDGRVLELHGRMMSRDWRMDGPRGPVLSSEPTSSQWSFWPDAWQVRCHDVSLDLAQTVGIVALNRIMVKANRQSAGSAG
ncbi:hypothetical protein [Nocardioides sambongensis]|uniref:hypothetical protein n=1 Tax=Nocardioides sambongensis TaxID=2589074 RepID=UPI00112BE325|nr:hypothetical protein [Nocardioides sambongensis]